jgi:hypothetical protein
LQPRRQNHLGYAVHQRGQRREKNVSRSAPEEATRRVVIEKFNEAHAKAQTPDQQRVVAADFYLGFSILHARAMPAY